MALHVVSMKRIIKQNILQTLEFIIFLIFFIFKFIANLFRMNIQI